MTTGPEDLAEAIRPKTLDQVIGQDTIKPIIKKYIEQQRRQWFFYGPTGTGKTSLAHIVARELRQSDDLSGILDLDCADLTPSDVRGLIKDTQTYPMNGEYWVVILDELQFLTKPAVSVLLKPLETVAPVVWILCAMDISKLDKALRDRCAEFEVKPMGQRERRELVSRAASHLNYTADTSRFLRSIDKHEVGSGREIIRAFEKFCNGMSAEEAVGE
jgi:putative ATPase